MKSLEKASKELINKNPDLRISSFRDILKKRVAPHKDSQPQKNQSVLGRENQSKKLKTTGCTTIDANKVSESTQKHQTELTKRTDFLHGDLRLKLGDKQFNHAFTKENIEKFLVFDLGK